MTTTPELSDAKRTLLEKYLKGDIDPMVLAPAAQTSVVQPVSVDAPSEVRVEIVPIQPAGSQPPLFYLHVHFIGGAFYAFALARELGDDQPLYVINPYRFEALPVPPSIEEMAAAYLEGMRAVQPSGPYRLAGFCGGSLIAYEIAQQVRAQGQEVESLILIDPNAGPIRSIRWTGRAIRSLGALFRLQPEQQVDWFLRARYLWRVLRRAHDENSEHLDRLLREWRAAHPSRRSLNPPAGALRQDWMNLFIWAVSAYVPRAYRGRMTYLFAEENPAVRRVWWGASEQSDLAQIRVIPGSHETCRAEHLPALARQVRDVLRSVAEG